MAQFQAKMKEEKQAESVAYKHPSFLPTRRGESGVNIVGPRTGWGGGVTY